MDSLTQVVLGASVGVAVMGRRTRPARSAAWGALAGTLPDLDVLLTHGDPILDMVLHRAETHAFFWLTLVSLPLALLVARLHGESDQWRRWWAALWLALVTHPLLDLMTIYGTQALLPFSDEAFGLGSVFIIDPLVTLPWAAGLIAALRAGAGTLSTGQTPGATQRPHPTSEASPVTDRAQESRGKRGLFANQLGLVVGLAYLAWGAALQQHVLGQARESLRAQGLPFDQVLATPTPFNSVLWRVVSVGDGQIHEAFYSLLDAPGPLRFDTFSQGQELAAELPTHDGLQRIRRFSDGFWALQPQADGRLLLIDLRMGQEPYYVFRFVIARRHTANDGWLPVQPAQAAGGRGPLGKSLAWLWRRMGGTPVAPPR